MIPTSWGWGGHDQENPERGCRESFREICSFFRSHSLYAGMFCFRSQKEDICRFLRLFSFYKEYKNLSFGCFVMTENLIDLFVAKEET